MISDQVRRERFSALSVLAAASCVVASTLSGCSSAPQKESGANASQGASAGAKQANGQGLDLDEPSIGSPQAGESTKAPAGGVDTNFKGRALDAKYQPLAQAVRAGRVEAIENEAQKILSENQYDPVALNALAMQYFRRGKSGAAKLLINKAFEKNPPSAALCNNMGLIYLSEGETALAIVNFKKALVLDDKNAQALGNLGSIYAEGGDWGKAKSLLEQAYRLNKTNLAVANNYALSLRGGKDYSAAERVYQEILNKDAKNVPALLNYAILLIDYQSRPKDGLAYVYKLKFLDPDKKEIVLRLNALEKKAQTEVK